MSAVYDSGGADGRTRAVGPAGHCGLNSTCMVCMCRLCCSAPVAWGGASLKPVSEQSSASKFISKNGKRISLVLR